MKRSLYTLILILAASVEGSAQISADLSLSTGNNNVSFGQYAKFAGQFSYKYTGWEVSIASGTVFSQAREKRLDAIRVTASKDYLIKDKQVSTLVFFQVSPFSNQLINHTAGLLLNHKSRRWYLDIGANTRFYSFTKKYKAATDYSSNTLWEPVNVMYRLTWHQPISNTFEINSSVTNFDCFIVEQETNPFLIADFRYKITSQSELYFDACYQQAGFFNIRVNYFGYFLRAGYKINIGKEDGNNIKLKMNDL